MNARIEITMYYFNISTEVTSSVTKVCTADLNKLKCSSDNIGGGKRENSLTGNVIVQKEYDDFGIYLNDSDYYVDDGFYTDYSGWAYSLWKNGTEYTTNKIKLIENDIDNKILTFKVFGEVENEYTKVYNGYSKKYNIVGEVSQAGSQVYYEDVRVMSSSNDTDTFNSANQSFSDYMNDKLINYSDTYLPYHFEFTLTGGSNYNVAFNTKRYIGYGYYDGSARIPPAGKDWIYNTDVGGYPQYYKKPNYGGYEDPYLVGSVINIDVVYEDSVDIAYTLVAFNLETVIEYLIGKADSSIIFDSNSFDCFYDFVGESFTGHSNLNRPFDSIKIMTMSDFIPALDGTQKSNKAEKGMISMEMIDKDFLSQNDFFWYLEESGGDYYFRMQHPVTKSLGSSNPDLTDYFGINRTFRKRNFKIKDPRFDKIVNSKTAGSPDFVMSFYEYREGEKELNLSETNIYTDLDYVIDVGESVFDVASGDQWVLALTSTDSVTLYKDVRRFQAHFNAPSFLNNYELSFYWRVNNVITMPGKVTNEKDVIDDDRIEKRKEVTISDIPIDDPFTAFDFYDTVSFYGEDAEIQNISKGFMDEVGNITLKIR